MAVTVKAVRNAFGLLYESILDRNFRKTLEPPDAGPDDSR